MLSLEAALLVAAGRPTTGAGADDVGTILLPSEGKGQAEMVASRPWKCCDRAFCTESNPMVYKCGDEVDQCASTCQACVPSTLNPSRHVCQDLHTGDPGPECSDDGGLNVGIAKAEGASKDYPVTLAAAKKKGEEEERPWKCCDFALCTRSFPPLCRCMDKVEQCAATCEKCEPATSDSSRRVCNDWSFPPMCRCMDKVEQCAATCQSCEPAMSDSSRRVCNDWYHGFPGPKCTAGGN
ncbi:unnamed protein product [Triticum turgidum subsp. durum]|uniref:Bowman-Birk serine protease inhibitors family domain-containing protein n=2 Tax=Triticum TaxID=4564 RepID=A0A9R1Q778_TRITD|nr:unnamed protein product [Triticum aestivum]VAH71408.1 unnamed protein product [Triticum turgidum subsp. durum]